jgi:hypothetical protein
MTALSVTSAAMPFIPEQNQRIFFGVLMSLGAVSFLVI